MSFPETIFGICQVCGADGGDDPNPSSADASARDTSGSGVILEEYEGKMMCKQCIQKNKADEESKIATDRRSEEERFRQAAGFTNTVS
ncbi:hypothetical protein EPO66_05710 [bacterium]|nr:MAG: hypothetical protein EPO66_05710 [bacterium]